MCLKKKVKVVGGCVFITGTFREGYMCGFCKFLMRDELFYMYLTGTTALCVNLMDSSISNTPVR